MHRNTLGSALCAGLNEMPLTVSGIGTLASQPVGEACLVRGNVSLVAGLESLKTHILSSLFSAS